MLNRLSKWIYEQLTKSKNINQEDAIYMIHGIEKILYNVCFFMTVIVVAFLLDVFVPMLVVLLAFNLVRRYGHGAHANSLYQCSVVSCIVFALVLPGILMIPAKYNSLWMVIGVLDLLIVYLYAPSDTQKNPILGQQVRNQLKIKAIISSTALYVMALCITTTWIKACILYGMTLESFLLLPMTYKLLKQRRNNYEIYECNY